jgi:hypothetical protein
MIEERRKKVRASGFDAGLLLLLLRGNGILEALRAAYTDDTSDQSPYPTGLAATVHVDMPTCAQVVLAVLQNGPLRFKRQGSKRPTIEPSGKCAECRSAVRRALCLELRPGVPAAVVPDCFLVVR